MINVLLCRHWSSLACFMKWNSSVIQKYAKYFPTGGFKPLVLPVGYKRKAILSCFLSFIVSKMYSFRDLFCVIDTVGVGCVTKLDPRQSYSIDSVRDRTWHRLKSAACALKNRGKDMDHSEVEEKLWTINSILREGEEDKMRRYKRR